MTEFAQLPLQPRIARKIIVNLFNEKSLWLRADLAKAMLDKHLASGGAMGTQAPDAIAKRVLSSLQDEGRIAQTGARGIWARADSAHGFLGEPQTPEEVIEEEETEEVEAIAAIDSGTIEIGSGSEAVYLYYSPNDKELADLKGNAVWECKIGATTALPVQSRIFSQGVRTAFSKMPVIALVIKTDNAVCLERAIHCALRIVEADAPDSPGSEWFITNPQKIIDWYKLFIEATHRLAI
jgi:hypothetical protein